jgi:hypothetical protein
MPVSGQLYTVANTRSVAGGQSIRLKELLPTCHLGGACACGECGWDASRFRRVLRPDGRLLGSLAEDMRVGGGDAGLLYTLNWRSGD